MTRIQWTPTEADASRYGLEGPQTLDLEQLQDMQCSELEAIERVLKANAGMLLVELWPPKDESMATRRAIMWTTLRLAGVGLDWGDFNPQVLRVGFQLLDGDDADPPSDGSEASDSAPESTSSS